MKPSFVSKMLNTFIATGALAILCFAIMRHYYDAKTALVLGVALSFMLSVGISFLAAKRRRRFGLRAAEVEHLTKVAKTLLLFPKQVVDEFFLRVIKKTSPTAVLNDGWIETGKQQILCLFDKKRTDTPKLARLLRSAPNSGKQKVVFGIEFEPDCASLGAKLLTAPEVYQIMKQNKIFPKVEGATTKRKLHVPHFFDRSKVLRYISLAVLFYFASLFVLYKNLYLFFAIISLLLAFFSLFAKKPKETFVLE